MPHPPPQLPLFASADLDPLAPPAPRASRHPWAWLLRRVFAVDVTTDPVQGCGGRMRLVEIAKGPDDTARVTQPPSVGVWLPALLRRLTTG